MLDDVGAGVFFANVTVAIITFFLLALDAVLIYIKDKKAKFIFISIVLNVISWIYLREYAGELSVFLNFLIWPLINFILITRLFYKNFILYKKNKEKYKVEHQQSKLRKIMIKTLVFFLFLFFFVAIRIFLQAWTEFLNY